MIKDMVSDSTQGEEIIEILISSGNVKVWVPVMATSLYSVTKDQELNKVEAVRIRYLDRDDA